MFTIEDIKNEYAKLDSKTGMNIAKTIPIKISNRCTKTRGQYTYTMSNEYGSKPYRESITISSFVLKEEASDFLDTIRHEYAHAMAARIHERFGLGHGIEWQECCHIVGCRDTARKNTITEAQKAAIENRKVYTIVCECGHKFTYHRKGKIVSLVESGSKTVVCPYCQGRNLTLEK